MSQKLSAFKNVFEQSKNVLWVATGNYDGQRPYNAMIVGFQRTLVLEMPHLRFQHLDLAADAAEDYGPQIIAKKLLQLEATEAWEQQDGKAIDHLWYTEPALRVQKGGAELVPRIRHNPGRNLRYNAGRRIITRDVDLDDVDTVVSLQPESDLPDRRDNFTVREMNSLTLDKSRGNGAVIGGDFEIQTRYSLLRPLPISDSGRPLHLCVGRDSRTGKHLVALTKGLNSRIQDSEMWAASTRFLTERDALKAMLNLYKHLLAHVILSGVPAGKPVVVLNASFALGTILSRRAADRNLRLGLLTTEVEPTEVQHTEPWTSVHPLATRETVLKFLPLEIVRFVDLANHTAAGAGHQEQELVAVILSCLRRGCSVMTWDSLMGVGATWNSDAKELDGSPTTASLSDAVKGLLVTVWAASQAEPTPPGGGSLPMLSLVDVGRAQRHEGRADRNQNVLLAKKLSTQAVVSWRGSSNNNNNDDDNNDNDNNDNDSNIIAVQVQPASSMVRFAADKTYWLVGLSGGLGLSLAEWMAKQGAGHIVISSRNPKVEQAWLDAMAKAHGCTIRVMVNDVTSRHDVQHLHGRIVKTMPPIAGVVHGAMVLDDTMFHDLDVERLAKVLRPKINGSLHLHEVFSSAAGRAAADDLTHTRVPPLEFFVFLSSMAYVVGNQGQSAYAAANAFITALAQQRRNLGLAASAVNIGAIVGKGYFSRETSAAGKAAIFRLGNQFMSEHDFHEMFAECVLASQSAGNHHGMPAAAAGAAADSPEISTGIRRLHIGENLPLWASNPIFQHLVPKASSHLMGGGGEGAGAGGKGSVKSAIAIKSQLLEATTADQVFDIIKYGLLAKLRIALQVDPAKLKIEQGLDELGVDSLVAVDLRSWFLKEVLVDIPRPEDPQLNLCTGASRSEPGTGPSVTGSKAEQGRPRWLGATKPSCSYIHHCYSTYPIDTG